MGYLLPKDRITDVDGFIGAVEQVANGSSVVDQLVVATLIGARLVARHRMTALGSREREPYEAPAEPARRERAAAPDTGVAALRTTAISLRSTRPPCPAPR